MLRKYCVLCSLIVFCLSGNAKAQTTPYLYFPEPKEKSRSRFLGIRNQWFRIDGDLKLGFTEAEEDDTYAFNSGLEGIQHNNQAIPRFFLEEILLTPQFSLANRMEGRLQISVVPDVISVKQGYAVVYLPGHSFLQFGLDKRFFFETTYTTILPSLLRKSFGDDSDLQIRAGGDYRIFGENNRFYWRSSLSNSQRLAENAAVAYVGKQQTYPLFSDTKQIGTFDSHKEVGLGLGFGRDFSQKKSIDIQAYSFFSKLHEQNPNFGKETVFLQNVIPGYYSPKRDRHRIGFDTTTRWGSYALWTQYIHGLDGQVKRQAVAVEPSFSWNSIDLIYRWNLLKVQTTGLRDNIPESPFTWDRTTHTLAMTIHSKYFFAWQNEFHINQEKTGAIHQRGVNNNEFLSQITFYF